VLLWSALCGANRVIRQSGNQVIGRALCGAEVVTSRYKPDLPNLETTQDGDGILAHLTLAKLSACLCLK
jgi:hypothetical protein